MNSSYTTKDAEVYRRVKEAIVRAERLLKNSLALSIHLFLVSWIALIVLSLIKFVVMTPLCK